MIAFVVPGNPQGKERPRFANGRAYTPEKTKNYEAWVKMCCRLKYKGKPLCGAIVAEIVAYYPISNSYTKKQIAMIERLELLPTKKPDGDNIEKAIFDALNGIAYKDDCQIIEQSLKKRYAIDGKPRVEVTIRQYGEP